MLAFHEINIHTSKFYPLPQQKRKRNSVSDDFMGRDGPIAKLLDQLKVSITDPEYVIPRLFSMFCGLSIRMFCVRIRGGKYFQTKILVDDFRLFQHQTWVRCR